MTPPTHTSTSTSSPPAPLHSLLPPLLRNDEGPVFSAPWQAQAFAMTLALYERQLFSWTEWAAMLAQTIKDAQAAGDPDTGEHYYDHWLAALEKMTLAKSLVDENSLAHRRAAWKHAAQHTPHGMAIVLK